MHRFLSSCAVSAVISVAVLSVCFAAPITNDLNKPLNRHLLAEGQKNDAQADGQGLPKAVWVGLSVGNDEESSDIVEDGVLLPILHPDYHSYQIGAFDSESSLFFRWSTDTVSLKSAVLKPTELGLVVTIDGTLINDRILDVYTRQINFQYACSQEGTFKIQFELQVESLPPLPLVWEKVCGTGLRLGIDVGLSPGSEEVVEDGVTKDGFKSKSATFVSEAEESSTAFFFQTSLGSQLIQTPRVDSSVPSVCDAWARGELSQGGLVSMDAHSFMVFYTCKGPGVSSITVTFGMGSFDAVAFTWTKHCGGGHKSGFDVVAIRPSSDIVVKNGAAQKAWSFDSHTIIRPLSEILTTFQILMNNGKTKEFGVPVVTTTPSGIANPFFTGEASHGGVADEIPQKLTLHYNCLTNAKVLVTVTVPISQYDPVEFTWVKECGKIEPHVSRTYLTANRLLSLIITFSILVFVGYVYYRKVVLRKKGADVFPELDSFVQ